MKIVIISDTHDNLANLKKVIGWSNKEKIGTIIHCGDIFQRETAKEISQNFKGKIYLVLADVDSDNFEDLPRVKFWKDFGKIKINGKSIAFSHFPETALELAKKQKYDLVFYGHTHKPWLKNIGKTKLANPGNLAGIFYKATFAVYDTKSDNLKLQILENLK